MRVLRYGFAMTVRTEMSTDQLVLFRVEFLQVADMPHVPDVVSQLRTAEALVSIVFAAERDWGIFAARRPGDSARSRVDRLGRYYSSLDPSRVSRLSLESPLIVELLLHSATIAGVGSSAVAIGFGLNRLMRSTMRTYSEWLETRVKNLETRQRIEIADAQLKSLREEIKVAESDPASFSRLAAGLLEMRPLDLKTQPRTEQQIANELERMESEGQSPKASSAAKQGSELIKFARGASKLVDRWIVD